MSSELSPEVLKLLNEANIETVKIEPINSGLVKKPDQEDVNYWKIAEDMALSAPQGIVNAIEEQGDFIDENIVSLGGLEFGDKDGKLTFKDFIPKYVAPSKWKSEEYSKKRQLPVFHKPETLAGNMTEGISRFITGFAGPAKFLKGAGLGGTAVKSTLRGLGAGAVADLTVFDPNEGRLSDMLVEFNSPVLNNAVTQYLATDENDTEMAGRLKNVLEGMALGGIGESIFLGIRGFKKMKQTKDLKKRAKIQKETSEVIQEIQKPKIKKITEDIDVLKEEKLLKDIDDFETISKKNYFAVASKTKELVKEYSGVPASKQEKYIIQTEYSKRLKAMTVSDVKISKNFRNIGAGKALYKIAIKNAFDKGLDFASDYSVSESAMRVYKSLKKEGFDVRFNKNVKTVKDGVKLDPERGRQIITKDRTDTMPVVIIKRKVKDIKVKSKKVRKAKLEDNPAIDTKQAMQIIKTTKQTAKKDSELWIKKVLNTKSFKNGDEVLHTIDDVAENMFDDATKEFLESDVLANETAEELATLMSKNKEDVLKSVIKEGQKAKEGTIRMLANKQLLQELAFDFQSTSKKYLDEFGEDSAKWSKEAKEEIALRMKVIGETFKGLKDQIRDAARTTQAGRIKVTRAGGKILEIEKIANIFKNYDANPAVVAKKVKDMKPEDIINEISKSKLSKYIEAFNSLYINSLLYGTYTHFVNILGNLYETILKPLEKITGGALTRDAKIRREGFSQFIGMSKTWRNSLKAAGIALRQGDAILDPLIRTQDNLQIVNGKAVRPISGSALGFDGKVGTGIDWFGRVAEFPTRLLMASDELFKQFNYNGRLYAEAVENTLELGFELGSKEGKANIDKIFKEGFDKNGKANVVDNDLAAKALENARVSTFTNTLDDGRYLNIGGAVQKFLQEAPYFRFLAPFVRTPTNLWRHAESRIPVLGAFTKPMRVMWNSGDRRARAEVIGRQTFGIGAATYAYILASTDIEDSKGNIHRRITGAGPKDFNIKRQWLANGWQSYSIAQKNKDGTVTYKQYNRMDPRFYILGIMADVFENKDNINDEQKQKWFTVAALSAMKSAANKSYLRGISDGFDLAENLTGETLLQYAGKQIGNAIPFQALLGQGIPGITEPDKDLYEARSFLDEIIKKAPFLEKTKYLEPRRDLLTGEPIEKTPNAVYFKPWENATSFLGLSMGPLMVGRKVDIKEDPVLIELMRLKLRLSEPNETKFRIVNLIDYKKDNQSAHNYWVERIGKTEISGTNLKDQLLNIIESVDYNRRQEGDENFEGGKEIILKRIFQSYKNKAYQDMLEEYPEVKDAILKARETKYGFRKSTYNTEEMQKEVLPRQ